MHNFTAITATGRALRLFVLLACVALLATACSKADNANGTNTSSPNKNSTTNTSSTTNSTATGTAGSPLAAYKAFQDANKKKDYEAVKKRFSKASLVLLTEGAKKENKSLDEFVKNQVDKATADEIASNEKINGDTGSVDIQSKEGGSPITLPMVKEDGEWKIAYDQFMKQMNDEAEKMGKELNKGNTNSGDKSAPDNK